MQRLHIIGRKNHGKTTLVVDLVDDLTRRGLRVGTIKHTHHRHELDVPGKDSHRHRTAGAAVVGILSKGLCAAFLPNEDLDPNVDRYATLAPVFASCDLVLVEGDSGTAALKVEVWRAEVGSRPLAEEDPGVLAVVTDDPLSIEAEVLPRAGVPALGAWIVSRLNA